MAKQISETFDPAQFLSQSGLRRRIVQFKANGVFFFQGEFSRVDLLPAKGTSSADCGLEGRQGSYYYPASSWRLHWRGVNCGGSWA
jgi:hypothetical protein